MITITTTQAILICKGIASLGGYKKAAGEQFETVPYSLTDAVRKKLRAIKNVAKKLVDDYEEGRVAIVKELSPVNEDIGKEAVEAQKDFVKRVNVLLADKHELDVVLLVRDGDLLKDNKNPIPDEVLEWLEPVCEEGQPKMEAKKSEDAPGGD